MADSVQICLVQESFLVGDIHGNCLKIIKLVDQARKAGADIVVFPELAVTGYPPEDLLLRDSFITQNAQAVQDIVQAAKGIDLVLGAPRSESGVLYNSAIWARDGEILACYDKYTLPNYAVFDEKRYFKAGSQPVVVDVKGLRLGLSICEDVWIPGPAQEAKEKGADAVLVLNASPYHSGKFKERVDNLKLRNNETGLPFFYVNLMGGQDELVFDGESLVID
ncbi:MAG: NAD+ synthase, partial [Gammaproteobacteria bacterium]|nr:NAD+ synthase [Gammaproteobacteria bacterium]